MSNSTGTRFDVVFLSVDEPHAVELYARMCLVFGAVKRLHGVGDLRRAYRLAADLVDTDEVLIATADFEVSFDFNPARIERLAAGTSARIWPVFHAANGLVYGHGGLTLCRRADLRDLADTIDVLAGMPGRVEVATDIAGRNRFNQTAFHAWTTAFRECALLARGYEHGMTDAHAAARLQVWTTHASGPFADETLAGARAGEEFAASTGDDDPAWQHLNNRAWVGERFARAAEAYEGEVR